MALCQAAPAELVRAAKPTWHSRQRRLGGQARRSGVKAGKHGRLPVTPAGALAHHFFGSSPPVQARNSHLPPSFTRMSV
jgi:hypothetical protein